MDRKYTKNNKALAFIKRNIYYIIMLLCLAAIATMVTITLINKSKDPNVDVIAPPPNNNEEEDPPNNNNEEDPPNNNEEEDPPTNDPDPIVFTSPVEEINIIRDYDTFAWNPTQGYYHTDLNIVFGGEEGDEVCAVFGGTIEEVTNDAYYGNRVVIKHEDELRTIYYSLKDVNVEVGDTVTKGQTIGTMGITATKELLDGPHVTLVTTEDNLVVSPYEYLDIGDK